MAVWRTAGGPGAWRGSDEPCVGWQGGGLAGGADAGGARGLRVVSGAHAAPAAPHAYGAPHAHADAPVDPTSEAALRAEMARLNRELEAKRASVTALLLQYCGSPTTECALPPGATTTLYRNLVQAVDELIRQLDAVTRTYWLLYGQP